MDWISVFSFFESSDKKGETYLGTYHLPTAAHDARGDKPLNIKNITWQINICTVLNEIKSQNCALSVCSVRLQ